MTRHLLSLMSLSGNERKSLAFRLILQYYKLEIRISKSETNSKSELRKFKTASHPLRFFCFGNLYFEQLILFRISDFVLRIFLALAGL